MSKRMNVDVCRYYGPATRCIPAGSWIAVPEGWWRRRIPPRVLFVVPSGALHRSVRIRGQHVGPAHARAIAIRTRVGWQLENPAEMPGLEAACDAAYAHVESCADTVRHMIY